MIDLETLGTTPTAPIVSIGAALVCADPRNTSFYYTVKPEGHAGFDTIAWWLKQAKENPDAANEVISAIENGPRLFTALQALNRHIDLHARGGDVCVWSKGANFDIVILEHWMRVHGVEPAWKYYNVRCFRTVEALYPDAVDPGVTTKHNAMEDAIWQAEKLHTILTNHVK
jgi:hypothetical protein